MNSITFKIVPTDRIRSKPRMTQRDVWLSPPRKPVSDWHVWRSDIIEAYTKAGGRLFKKPVVMGFIIYTGYENKDLDNIIKGIKDALKGYALIDDKIKYVVGYKHAYIISLTHTKVKEYALVEIEEL